MPCGFQGGGSFDLNFVKGGGVIQNLDDGSKFQPVPPADTKIMSGP